MTENTPIREICEQYELTQAGLAKRFGIPIRTVEQWCTGKRHPPEYVVAMITRILQHEAEQTEQVEPIFTYEDAIKQLVTSGKAEEILSSDKAKLLSTPAFTPTGDISPEWAEWLARQKHSQKE